MGIYRTVLLGAPSISRRASDDAKTLAKCMLYAWGFRTKEQNVDGMPMTYDFLRNLCPEIRTWGDHRMQAAYAEVCHFGYLRSIKKWKHGCKKMHLWVIGPKDLRHARKDMAQTTTTIEATVTSVEDTAQDCPPTPVPGQGSVAPESDVLDAYCGQCPHCGGELESNGFMYLCPGCGAYDVEPKDYGGRAVA
jgi:hypothetical protein